MGKHDLLQDLQLETEHKSLDIFPAVFICTYGDEAVIQLVNSKWKIF